MSPLAIAPAAAQGADAAAPEDEIVVTGTRSSIINSLDEKRNSESIADILSADQLDNFPDPNIAEALARIPGISFQRENESGEGEFISIRGLDSAFNTVLFNGLRAGTADSFRRTPLDIITGDNVSSVKVTKAPLPEDASEGIGGVVDIRTRGPLERRRDTFFVSADGRFNSFNPEEGFRVGGGFTKKFSDSFGVNFSGSFRKRYLDTIFINPATTVPELVNAVTLTGQDGTQITFTDEDALQNVPTNFVPIESFNTEQVNYEYNDLTRQNINLSGSIDWRPHETTTFTIGGRFARTDSDTIVSNIEFDADNDGAFPTLTEPEIFDDPEVTFEGQVEDEEEIQARLFARGLTQLDNWTFSYVGGYSRAFEDRPILSIDYTNDFDDVAGGSDDAAVTFAPFDLSGGPIVAPVPLDQDVFLLAINPFCENPAESSGRCGEINDFDEDLENSLENERWSARLDTTYEFDDLGYGFIDNIKVGGQWERSTFTDIDIQITGVDESFDENFQYVGVDPSGDNDAVIGDFGFVDGSEASFDRIGSPFDDIGLTGIPLWNGDRLRELRRTFREGFLASGDDPLATEIIEAEESFYTAYVQTKLTFGKLDVVGGVRVEQYDAEFSAPITFDADISFTDQATMNGDSVALVDQAIEQNLTSTDNFEVLPRVALNYNLSDDAKIRASYTTALARPTFDLLAGSVEGDFLIEIDEMVALESATLADVQDVSASFDLGNPNLVNAYSHNFDVSFEYYFDSENAISIAGFYKSIDSFIFNSFAADAAINNGLFVDPEAILASVQFSPEGLALVNQLGGLDALLESPNASDIEINQPVNGNRAEVFGLEVGLFHTFTYLPGLFSNLGFVGNVTWQETSIDLDLARLTATDALVQLGDAQEGDVLSQEFDFFNSPSLIGNAALFYQDRNIEATVAYRYSGVQLEEIEAFGIAQFQQGRGFLDIDFEYTIRDFGPARRATLFFSANDLLDDGTRFTTFESRGKTDAFSDFASFNGRTFTAGARVRF